LLVGRIESRGATQITSAALHKGKELRYCFKDISCFSARKRAAILCAQFANVRETVPALFAEEFEISTRLGKTADADVPRSSCKVNAIKDVRTDKAKIE